MSQSLLTSLLGGAFVGLVITFVGIQLYIRKQHRSATGILATTKREAEKLLADATKEAEAGKSEAGRFGDFSDQRRDRGVLL